MRAAVYIVRRCEVCRRCFEAKAARVKAGKARLCSRLCAGAFASRAAARAREIVPIGGVGVAEVREEIRGASDVADPSDEFRPRLQLPRTAQQRRSQRDRAGAVDPPALEVAAKG